MQVTIDSTEPLDRVLPVINALYGVSLSALEPTSAGASTPAPAVSRRSRTSTSSTRKQPGRRNKRAAVSAGTVREWARANGHDVSARGRISTELVEAYRAAN